MVRPKQPFYFLALEQGVHVQPLTSRRLCPRAVNPKNGRPSGMISDETYKAIMDNAERLNSAVIYNRDFSYVRHLFSRSSRARLRRR